MNDVWWLKLADVEIIKHSIDIRKYEEPLYKYAKI